MCDVGRIGTKDALGDCDLHRVKAPCANAAKKEGIAELVFTRNNIGNVTEWAIERKDAVGNTRIDHASKRVVPEVLLVNRSIAFDISVDRILTNQIPRMTAANTRGLHAAIGRQVRRAQRKALHARAGSADLFDVGNATSGLKNCVYENRAIQLRFRLKLRQ